MDGIALAKCDYSIGINPFAQLRSKKISVPSHHSVLGLCKFLDVFKQPLADSLIRVAAKKIKRRQPPEKCLVVPVLGDKAGKRTLRGLVVVHMPFQI